MREFTYGELKQGLACCLIYKDCKTCPFFIKVDDFTCTTQLMSAAMNCINVMEKDLADANKRADDWEEFARNMSKEHN